MLKVAVLDDYQNIFSQIINLDEYKSKYEFTIFNEPFQNELEITEALKGFEVLFIMRERTKITKTLISNLPKLKFIMTSGTRNNAIDFNATKEKKILVCGTDINPNPAAEITWALILGLYRNMKQEIDKQFPIMEAVYQILYEEKSAKKVMAQVAEGLH